MYPVAPAIQDSTTTTTTTTSITIYTQSSLSGHGDTMSGPVTLFCLLHFQRPSSAFEVQIDRQETFSALKELIVSKNPNYFNGVDPRELRLWRISMEVTRRRAPWCEPSDQLNPTWAIGRVFSEEEPPEPERIHIFIIAPRQQFVPWQQLAPWQQVAPWQQAAPWQHIVEPPRENPSALFSSTDSYGGGGAFSYPDRYDGAYSYPDRYEGALSYPDRYEHALSHPDRYENTITPPRQKGTFFFLFSLFHHDGSFSH